MKKTITCLALLFITSQSISQCCGSIFAASHYNVRVNCSEPDADIIVDGQQIGKGGVEIRIKRESCSHVKIKKLGYVTEELDVCYKGAIRPKEKTYVELKEDEAYNSSIRTDIANEDISIIVNPDLSNQDSWKLLSQIITQYFDVIETSDRETGYLRTSWELKNFLNSTYAIRTRVIIKLGAIEPLSYKMKIQSEYSIYPKASVKSDEKFKEWDRLLRRYEGLVPEIQSRLQKQ